MHVHVILWPLNAIMMVIIVPDDDHRRGWVEMGGDEMGGGEMEWNGIRWTSLDEKTVNVDVDTIQHPDE